MWGTAASRVWIVFGMGGHNYYWRINFELEIANGNMSEQHQHQQRVQQLADEEARRWWSEQEMKAEKEMSLSLHKRMETQRAQIHAFKLEQSKWEHELQLRISKYAHDRKLLSEHNIELQEALTSMEERHTKLQRDNDLQATLILELEGQLRDATRTSQQTRDLRVENDALTQRVIHWESSHKAEVAAAVKQQEELQNEWISGLEKKLEEVLQENFRLRETATTQPDLSISRRTMAGSGGVDTGGDVMRVGELEKAIKQKDQIIVSLKSMLERHETISDGKMKLIQSKYDQVKAINIALQKKLLQTLTEAEVSNIDKQTA